MGLFQDYRSPHVNGENLVSFRVSFSWIGGVFRQNPEKSRKIREKIVHDFMLSTFDSLTQIAPVVLSNAARVTIGKKISGYLARARARARSARPPRAGGPGLPHVQKRQVKHVLTRARVEILRSFARAGRACYVVFWLQRTIATSSANWALLICSENSSYRGVKWHTWKVGSQILRASSSMGFSAQNPGFENIFLRF